MLSGILGQAPAGHSSVPSTSAVVSSSCGQRRCLVPIGISDPGEVSVLPCFLFCSRQLIYNYPEQLFGGAGVMAIEHADFAGVERLALVTGTAFASHKQLSLLDLLSVGVCDSLLRRHGNPLKDLDTTQLL